MGLSITSHPAMTGGAEAGTAQPSAKLKKAAQEFESILLANWLEKMQHSFVGSSDSQDPAHKTLGSLGTQAVASALAARGGIGIARLLLRQLQPKDTHHLPAEGVSPGQAAPTSRPVKD